MSSAPTTLQFEELPDEESYPTNSDAAAFMASFAQSERDQSSDEDRDDSPIQIMSHVAVVTLSPQRQTHNQRRKSQRQKAHIKANPPSVTPATRKHPFWQLLSPEQYLKVMEGWEWNLSPTSDGSYETMDNSRRKAHLRKRDEPDSTRQYAIQRMLDELNSSASEIRPPPPG